MRRVSWLNADRLAGVGECAVEVALVLPEHRAHHVPECVLWRVADLRREVVDCLFVRDDLVE